MTASEKQAYHARPELSYSIVKEALVSAKHYRWRRENPLEQTDAMLMGTLIEALYLDGEKPESLFCVRPEGMDYRTKEGKAWRANQTLPAITQENYINLMGMLAALKASDEAEALVAWCPENQRMVLGQIQGLPFRGLLDRSGRDQNGRRLIVDLKKCVDSSPEEFAKTITDRSYHLQASIYCYLLAAEELLEQRPLFCWIAVAEKPPHDVCCYAASREIFDLGEMDLKIAIDRIKESEKTGEWKGASPGIKPIKPPSWVMRDRGIGSNYALY